MLRKEGFIWTQFEGGVHHTGGSHDSRIWRQLVTTNLWPGSKEMNSSVKPAHLVILLKIPLLEWF